jgi:chromosome partitioning protein
MDDEGVISPARVVKNHASQRFTVLVANAKGGCGKTTVSTNLAGYYASQGLPVSLLDLDPQQSAGMWLNLRNGSQSGGINRLSLPLGHGFSRTRLKTLINDAGPLLIIDSPAGLEGEALDALLEISQVVLVPVLPSPIDIRAATRFLQSVMLTRHYQRRPRRLAVVANRSRERTLMFGQLQRFLNSLKIPYLTALRDSQLYVHAAGEGKGIMELDAPRALSHQRDWQRIVEWLEIQRHLMRSLPGMHPQH